jgi:hypothetical protein
MYPPIPQIGAGARQPKPGGIGEMLTRLPANQKARRRSKFDDRDATTQNSDVDARIAIK